MDPITAFCNALTAVVNNDTARINGMTPAQREKYLQIPIDAGVNIAKGFQDLMTRAMDLFHPPAK